LNLYLNKTTTIQSFIIHLTSYIHWLTNKDIRLSTSERHSCIELDSEVCTCHIPSICSDQLIFQTSNTVCLDQFLFQTSGTVPICTRLIHMSYSDQLIFQTSDVVIWTSFDSSPTGKLHLYESNVPVESGYTLR